MGRMTPRERVRAVIDLQEPDRVPCAMTFGHFVARHAGIAMADFLMDADLQASLRNEVFDELGGVDLVMLTQPDMFTDRAAALSVIPMRMKMPGKDIPADSIPQFDEFELMPVEGYDGVRKKGWARYVQEVLVTRAYPDAASPCRTPSSSHRGSALSRHFFKEKDVFVMRAVQLHIPFELFSFARSVEKFTVDLYRRPRKVLAAIDAIMPELLAVTQSLLNPGEPVVIPVSRGSAGFIGPAQFEKFVFPRSENWQMFSQPGDHRSSSISTRPGPGSCLISASCPKGNTSSISMA